MKAKQIIGGVSVATILVLASPAYAVNLGGGAIGGFGGTLGAMGGGVRLRGDAEHAEARQQQPECRQRDGGRQEEQGQPAAGQADEEGKLQ